MEAYAEAVIHVIQTQICYMKMEALFIEHLLCAKLCANHAVCYID